MINYPIYVNIYPTDDINATYVIRIDNDIECKMFLLLGNAELNLFTWERREKPKKIWSTYDINLPRV